MKKSVKILGTISAAALAAVAMTSCKHDSPADDTNTATKPSETETEKTNTESKPTESTKPSTTTGGSSTSTGTTTSGDTEYSVTVNKENVKTTYILGQKISYEGLVITDSLGNVLAVDGTNENVIIDVTAISTDNDNCVNEVGEYEVKIIVKHEGKVVLRDTISISVVAEIVQEISTVEEFLAMRQYNDESGYNLNTYKLTADIDLTGVELPDPAANLKGKFDGNGHTIKNAVYAAGSSKLGLLFDTVQGNAVVENVKFFNCSVSSTQESCAIIAGETTLSDSNITIKNVEFNLCTVSTSNNYAGFAIARSETGTNITFNLENITVKNYSSVSCSQYGGGIFGDINTSTVIAKNLDLDFTSTTSANGSQLVGRNRGGNITAENIIFRGTFDTDSGSCGYVNGGGKESATVIMKNILVLGTHNGSGDLLFGNSKATSLTAENIYYVNAGKSTVKDSYAQIAQSTVTADWCTSTLNLDDAWEADSTTVIKLKSASSNTPSEDATVVNVQISTTTVKKEYFAADKFSLDGISIISIYSDGALKISQTVENYKIYNEQNEEVSLTDGTFGSLPTGDYTVKITDYTQEPSFVVQLVKYTDVQVETGDTSLIYIAGNKLDLSNVYVYSNKTNGTRDYVAIKNCQVEVKCGDTVISQDAALSTVGEYTVTVTANGFSASYKFEVVQADEQNKAYVKVVVDQAQEASQVWNSVDASEDTASYTGYYSFNTIEKAVNYLTNLGLADDAAKVIEVKAGTYREKVTVSIPNVTIYGAGEANTQLVYNVCEDSTPLNGSGTYGMNCATLIATDKAVGFTLSNISVTNDFDYEHSTLASKQAFAFQSNADKTVVKNVTFSSVQDTLYANAGRQYYYKCTIKGAVDYVFGEKDVTAYFDECTFHTVARKNTDGSISTNTGYVFAPKSEVSETKLTYNYVVVNSTFEADENVPVSSISVARPWGAKGGVAILDSTFTNHYSKDPYTGSGKPRYDAMSNQSPANANFYEYNNSGEGSISEEVAGVKFLTEEQAANYRDISKVLAETNGGVKYTGGEFAPKTEAVVKTFVKWNLGKEKYDLTEDKAFVASTIVAYDLSYNSTTGELTTYKAITPTEKYYNAESAEVTSETIMTTAGTYTVKLVYNDAVLGEKEIISSQGQTETTIEWTYGGKEWSFVNPTNDVTCPAGSYTVGTVIGVKTETNKVSTLKGSNDTIYIESAEFDASTSAKISIVAGSTASSKKDAVQIYRVDALDASGNVVGTVNISITGCGDGSNKLLMQSDEVTLTSETSFVQLRIYAVSAAGNTNKSHTITQIKTILS